MLIHDIAHLPTTWDREISGAGMHESCLRAYHIVQKIKDLAKCGCSNDILLELIEVMEYRHKGTSPHVHVRNADE